MAYWTDGVVPWNSLDNNTRAPVTSEFEVGYPCGELDRSLFNWTAGYTIGQIYNLLLEAGIDVDWSDLTQLTKGVQALFVIDEPVVKTVYGTGADFADLNAAHAWASRFRIIGDGLLTLSLATGKFTSSELQFFSHVDGRKVIIDGEDLTGGGFPTDANMAVTGSSSGQRATDKAANIITLRARFPTELAFTGSAFLWLGNVGIVRNLLVTGDGTAVDGLLALGADNMELQQVVAFGFGGRGIVSAMSRISLTNVLGVANGTTGLSFEGSSDIGMFARVGGYGNTGSGVAAVGGTNLVAQLGAGSTLIGRGNGLHGVVATGKGRIQTSGSNASIASSNAGSGWLAEEGGYIRAPSSVASFNGAYGYLAQVDGTISAQNTTGASNVSAGYGATDKSYISTTGGSAGSTSPAVNTIGNNFSYISN